MNTALYGTTACDHWCENLLPKARRFWVGSALVSCMDDILQTYCNELFRPGFCRVLPSMSRQKLPDVSDLWLNCNSHIKKLRPMRIARLAKSKLRFCCQAAFGVLDPPWSWELSPRMRIRRLLVYQPFPFCAFGFNWDGQLTLGIITVVHMLQTECSRKVMWYIASTMLCPHLGIVHASWTLWVQGKLTQPRLSWNPANLGESDVNLGTVANLNPARVIVKPYLFLYHSLNAK